MLQGLPQSFLVTRDSQVTSGDFCPIVTPCRSFAGCCPCAGWCGLGFQQGGHQTCQELVGESFSGFSSSLRGAGTVGGDGPGVKWRSSHCCTSGHQPLRGNFAVLMRSPAVSTSSIVCCSPSGPVSFRKGSLETSLY